MGLRSIRWICAVVASVCAMPVEAREADPRLRSPYLRAGYPRFAPRRDVPKSQSLSLPQSLAQSLALLGQIDRKDMRTARTHRIEQTFGFFDLAIGASRIRGGRGDLDEPVTAGDRYSASTLVLNADFALGDGLYAGPTASLMKMKRHFSVVPSGLRLHTTDLAAAGLRIWRDDGPALSLAYISTSGRHVSPLDRMAEIAGGAPLAGRGFRFGLTGGGRDPQARDLTWGLTLSALKRPRRDFALNDIDGTLADRRIELSIEKAF